MHSRQRHQIILDQVTKNGFASIERLVELCGVSSQTLRRDFATLGEAGLITRMHGGASSPSTTSDPSYSIRKRTSVEAKRDIALLAANIIPHRSSLFVSGGTTMEAFMEALTGKQGLFIMTSSLQGALTTRDKPDWLVYVPHGRVVAANSLTGAEILPAIDQCRMDFCVISAAAIDLNGDFYERNYQVVPGIQAMKRNARQIILVADSNKFQRQGAVRTGTLSEVTYFVTDARPPESIADMLQAHNVHLVYPGSPHTFAGSDRH